MLQIVNFDRPESSTDERISTLASELHTSQLCSSVIYGSNVTVNVKSTNHTSGSSLVTTKNISNYAWEAEKIPGSLIAMHCSGNHIAYGLKGPNGLGMVRIIHCGTGVRGLIKNIAGVIRDVSFAYLTDQVLLACVDQFGSLFVYEIYNEENSLRTELKLQVTDMGPDSQRTNWWHESGLQRVVWCPYIPENCTEEEADEDNCALMLTVTNGTVAEVWHLGLVLANHDGPIINYEVKIGYLMITDHSGGITDAAFSPDGTALATASMDGFVKFFQMKFETPFQTPRCLHQWNPHHSQPLSCLFFLDNYKHPIVDGLWKYAVTGANNNTELKVWSCQNWECHQTINFNLRDCSPMGTGSFLNFKASIDPSSRHIILSDYARRVLCIAILNVDQISESAIEMDQPEIHIVKFISISEIPIHMGAICLAINDAAFKIYKQWKDESHLCKDEGDDENDMKIVEGLVMQCFLINQTNLQEAIIKFQPCLPLDPLKKGSEVLNISSSRDNSISLQDGLTDLSLTMNATTIETQGDSITREDESAPSFPNSVPEEVQNNGDLSPDTKLLPEDVQCIMSPPSTTLPLNLLTPESFNTLPKKEEMNILNELGLHVGSFEDSFSRRDSNQDKTRTSSSVFISNSGISFYNGRKNRGNEEWGNKLNGAVASSPSTTRRVSDLRTITKESEDDLPGRVGTPTDLLQRQDPPVVTVSSSTSSPSLEVQQILHIHQNGKIDEYIEDTEEGSPEEKFDEDSVPKNLVDILPPFSVENNAMPNVWEGQQPPLPTSQAMPLLKPNTISVTKEDILVLQVASDKISDDIKNVDRNQELESTNLLHQIVNQTSARMTVETDQAPQLSEESSQESQLGIFQLKSLPPVSNQLTCAQLEARIIKSDETPASKSCDNLLWNGNTDKVISPPLSDIPPCSLSIRDFSDKVVEIQEELAIIKNSINSSEDNKTKQLTQQISKLAAQLGKTTKQMSQISKQIEEMKKDSLKFGENLPNLVAQNIKVGLENSIKKELKSVMYPATAKSMTSFIGSMQSDMRGVLGNLEHKLIDHVSCLVQSKRFIDSVSTGLSATLSSSVNRSVYDCHSKVLVPSFNASTSQMFSQINDAFSKGTKEYMNHVQAETQAIQATIGDKLTKGCQQLETACSATEDMAKNITKNNGLTEVLESRLRIMIREEVGKIVQEHSALLERHSRAQTPLAASSQSPFNVKYAQQQLQTYISRQEFNNAFKHALMLSDLSLVVFVCERVNPQQLFSHSPCPLTQDVLLSLINQLSYDLSTYTDLKIKYLEEAVITLDMNHEVTKEYLRQVLGDCQRALSNHLTINPNLKKLKMLLLAVNQLLSSV